MSNSALMISHLIFQPFHKYDIRQSIKTSLIMRIAANFINKDSFFRQNLKPLCSEIVYIITLYKAIVLCSIKVYFSGKNLSSWTLNNRHFLSSLLSFTAQIEVIHEERSLFSMIFHINIR